jgi:hypothetical protein
VPLPHSQVLPSNRNSPSLNHPSIFTLPIPITTLLTIRLGVRLWLHFKTPRLGLWKPPPIPHRHRLLVGYLANAVDAPNTSDRFSILTLAPVAEMKLGAKCKCCLLKFPASRPLSRVSTKLLARARRQP